MTPVQSFESGQLSKNSKKYIVPSFFFILQCFSSIFLYNFEFLLIYMLFVILRGHLKRRTYLWLTDRRESHPAVCPAPAFSNFLKSSFKTG
ncbi:hypothetical protein JB92DRAFT_649369 [Gautieria morchelliformis]|nr:hypothetical protein JB92DRAFT_649369 [Gautieria morchelliformis]